MTLIFELDLDIVRMNQHAKNLGQQLFSFKSYCLNSQTHIPVRLLYLDL